MDELEQGELRLIKTMEMRRRMRLKIKDKLFATLFLAGVVVAIIMFLFLQWNFDRGFLHYINSQEKKHLKTLSGQLAKEYAKHGGWSFLEGNFREWRAIQGQLLSEFPVRPEEQVERRRPRPIGPPPFRRGAAPPPPPDPAGLGMRTILFDAEKQHIIGGPPKGYSGEAFQPIESDGVIVGYLGLEPIIKLSETGDLKFVEQQTEAFGLVALTMLVLSLLITFPIASHLLRPINELTKGTLQLIAGKFTTRIPAAGRDELAVLSDHFNTLALTLEENEKSRRQWVADISHELRTPLAVLLGEIEAIQDGVRKPDPDTINGLHGEVEHLARLVNDLYELSMTDAGALTYKKVEVDPVGILQGVLESCIPRYSAKGITVNMEQMETLGPFRVSADPDRLHQLFLNLLENSLRYTDSPGTLEVTVQPGGRNIRICFQDSAPGVNESQLKRLFERLYRAEESRNRFSGGAGLGMTICKNIVHAHQGRITAEHSSLGGLAVVIELPLSA